VTGGPKQQIRIPMPQPDCAPLWPECKSGGLWNGPLIEDPFRVDADRGIEDFVQGGIADQRGQHVGAAVGKYRQLVVPQVGKRLSRVGIKIEVDVFVHYPLEDLVVVLQA
jgi:hypothetical protein